MHDLACESDLLHLYLGHLLGMVCQYPQTVLKTMYFAKNILFADFERIAVGFTAFSSASSGISCITNILIFGKF